MKSLKTPVILGGLIPAVILGVAGTLMKESIKSGLGIDMFLGLVGGTLVLVGLVCCQLTGWRDFSPVAILSGIGTGVLWSLGTGLVLLALDRFGASVSQLAPLYNMNTLVVVLLGLLIFSEWKKVRPVPLLIGAVLIVFGAIWVARA